MPSRWHESPDRTPDTASYRGLAGRLGERTIIPPCTTGTATLVSRLSTDVVYGSQGRPHREAYLPRMPNRRVSSVFHGMVLVLSGSKVWRNEGSGGLCCWFLRVLCKSMRIGTSWVEVYEEKNAETML